MIKCRLHIVLLIINNRIYYEVWIITFSHFTIHIQFDYRVSNLAYILSNFDNRQLRIIKFG